ncbi:MAG: hypothetical protein HY659_03200 [Rhizobiales bacterium]|nr:hypothetical protein [Hyphomicrobiales bacterium]
MRTILIAMLVAIGLGLGSGAVMAAPANGSPAGTATLLNQQYTPVAYCKCGRVCYSWDYYGRCIGWRCKACYYGGGYRY